MGHKLPRLLKPGCCTLVDLQPSATSLQPENVTGPLFLLLIRRLSLPPFVCHVGWTFVHLQCEKAGEQDRFILNLGHRAPGLEDFLEEGWGESFAPAPGDGVGTQEQGLLGYLEHPSAEGSSDMLPACFEPCIP